VNADEAEAGEEVEADNTTVEAAEGRATVEAVEGRAIVEAEAVRGLPLTEEDRV
jgi:hypothetical protein